MTERTPGGLTDTDQRIPAAYKVADDHEAAGSVWTAITIRWLAAEVERLRAVEAEAAKFVADYDDGRPRFWETQVRRFRAALRPAGAEPPTHTRGEPT